MVTHTHMNTHAVLYVGVRAGSEARMLADTIIAVSSNAAVRPHAAEVCEHGACAGAAKGACADLHCTRSCGTRSSSSSSSSSSSNRGGLSAAALGEEEWQQADAILAEFEQGDVVVLQRGSGGAGGGREGGGERGSVAVAAPDSAPSPPRERGGGGVEGQGRAAVLYGAWRRLLYGGWGEQGRRRGGGRAGGAHGHEGRGLRVCLAVLKSALVAWLIWRMCSKIVRMPFCVL